MISGIKILRPTVKCSLFELSGYNVTKCKIQTDLRNANTRTVLTTLFGWKSRSQRSWCTPCQMRSATRHDTSTTTRRSDFEKYSKYIFTLDSYVSKRLCKKKSKNIWNSVLQMQYMWEFKKDILPVGFESTMVNTSIKCRHVQVCYFKKVVERDMLHFGYQYKDFCKGSKSLLHTKGFVQMTITTLFSPVFCLNLPHLTVLFSPLLLYLCL